MKIHSCDICFRDGGKVVLAGWTFKVKKEFKSLKIDLLDRGIYG